MKELFIIIDGLGYDQITHFMPKWIVQRAHILGLKPLDTLLAYSSGIYPSIWTGKYPDQLNYWNEFYRISGKRSVLTQPLRALPGKYFPRKVAYIILGLLDRINISRFEYYGIPPILHPFFDRLGSKYWKLPPIPLPSSMVITEYFKKIGKTWKYLFFNNFNSEAERTILDVAATVDILIVCFSVLDQAGHNYGPFTKEYGQILITFDNYLDGIIKSLEKTWPKLAVFMFSDHGMTSVIEPFDAWTYLEKHHFRLGRDYIAFINSTLMSLWFNKSNKNEIIDVLNKSGFGKVLSIEELIRNHVHFNDSKYGDGIFLAHEGVELIPNFLSVASKPNLGMHGYEPTISSTRAFIVGGNQVTVQPQDIVGIFDLLKAGTLS